MTREYRLTPFATSSLEDTAFACLSSIWCDDAQEVTSLHMQLGGNLTTQPYPGACNGKLMLPKIERQNAGGRHDRAQVTRFQETVLTGDERAAGIRTDARENQKILYAITKRPASIMSLVACRHARTLCKAQRLAQLASTACVISSTAEQCNEAPTPSCPSGSDS